MYASILTIGKEILIGQTVDTNSAWLGNKLENLGIQILEQRSVADKADDIQSALFDLYNKSELVVITGGLGPTNDDITKSVIADFLGAKLEFDNELFERISRIFNKRNLEITEAIHKQCLMPVGIVKLKNRLGTAPGMWHEKESKFILSMPGVPFEMKSIFEKEAIPLIEKSISRKIIYHKTLMTAGIGESSLAKRIKSIEESLPKTIDLAYLPNIQQVKLRISGIGDDNDIVVKTVESVAQEISEVLGDLVYSTDEVSLEESLMDLFVSKNKKLAVAESCTGGMLSHKITLIPGSSEYFIGGYVVYSNELKTNLLGVKKETIENYGAVSEETVLEMIRGLFNTTEADIGISISGVAGPSGGTYNKPVGTVWMAFGSREKVITRKLELIKDRRINIEYSVNYGMNELRKFLLHQ